MDGKQIMIKSYQTRDYQGIHIYIYIWIYIYVMTKSSVIHQQSKMRNMEIVQKMLKRELNAQIK